MKIHVEFNSLAEMLNFARTMGNGLEPTKPKPNEDYKEMYEKTLANLERAYERIRMADPEGKTANKDPKDERDVAELGISVRAMNGLHGAQIFTVGQLKKTHWSDICKLPNIGKVTAKEIAMATEQHGYRLKGFRV